MKKIIIALLCLFFCANLSLHAITKREAITTKRDIHKVFSESIKHPYFASSKNFVAISGVLGAALISTAIKIGPKKNYIPLCFLWGVA